MAYMSILCSQIQLDEKEKENEDLKIRFGAVPVLKIGQLAVDKKYKDR